MTIFEFYKARRRERIIKAAIAEGLMVPSVSGDRILRKARFPIMWRSDYTLQNSELLFSAVSRLANALSAMPIQLYKGSTPINSDLNDLMRYSPNPNMTSCTFFKTLEACRCTNGNAYALKVYNANGAVERLEILNPSRVKPIIEQNTGELWYKISPDKELEKGDYYVHNYHILHFPFISTSGISGVSPVSVLLDTLNYNENIQTFSRDQLEKGVNAAIVLEAPANLGDAQKQKMVEAFMKTYRETSGNILLLESGVTARTLNLSPVDSKLFEVEKISRGRVAMVYNIPPHMMGDYSDSSYSSQEQSTLEFLMTTMLQIVTIYEQECDRKMLSRDQRKARYHWEIDMDAILRADASTRAEVDYKAIRSGWKTVDEVRASYNLPPHPGGIGKKALVSQDLATLDYTVNEKPKVLAGKTNAALPAKSEDDKEQDEPSAPSEE